VTKRDSQIVGNTGLYYVSYQLSKFGWNVMPTTRNAKGIDIVAYNQDASRYIGIQVKSLSARAPVPLGTSLEKIMGDFWIVVNNLSGDPNCYILLPDEVKQLAYRGEKEERVSYWLQPNVYDKEDYKDAWHRLDITG